MKNEFSETLAALSTQMQISVVVPVFNEAENVAALHREIIKTCHENGYLFEIIFIDDGSTDNTYHCLKQLSPIKIIRFRKNFGQTAALDAGLKSAKFPYVVTMDGDCQNDPADIPKMLHYMEENHLDVVSGWRKKRMDGFVKKFISKGAHLIRTVLINDKIHDSGCTLKVYRKKCFDNLNLYGEMHRFIPALLLRAGFTIGEIPVNHRPRQAGQSKYNWRRMIKGFVDMLSIAFWHKFSSRPLHFLGGLGILFILLSFFSALVTYYNFLMGQGMSETAWPLLTVFLFLVGLQFFISGLITDVVLRTHYETTNSFVYNIKETIENE